MKQYFLILFFIHTSIHCSMYVNAKVTFTYLSCPMFYDAVQIQQNIVPDRLVRVKGEFCCDVQCNVINNYEGTLRLTIKPNDDSLHSVQAIISLIWGKEVLYKDDYIHVICSVYKLLNS